MIIEVIKVVALAATLNTPTIMDMQDLKLIMGFLFSQFITIFGLINRTDVTFFVGLTGSIILSVYYCIKIYKEFKK